MIWWYRNVFINRNLPLTGEQKQDRPHSDVQTNSRLIRLVSQAFGWLNAKLHEKLKSHADWKVYRNLSDHQLKDIGITRYDLHLLLKNKTPVIPQQKLSTVRKPIAPKPHAQLARDSELAKPTGLSTNRVCCNDSENMVA